MQGVIIVFKLLACTHSLAEWVTYMSHDTAQTLDLDQNLENMHLAKGLEMIEVQWLQI